MRICFLIDSFFRDDATINGSQVQTLMIARELMGRGHDVVVLAGSDSTDAGSSNRIHQGVPVFSFRQSGRHSFLSTRSACAALRGLAPDVVYVRGRSHLVGVAAWQKKRRKTGFVWASNGEDGCERWKRLRRLWSGSRPLYRKLLRTPGDFVDDTLCDIGLPQADRHVCQTQHQCERLKAVHRRTGVVVRSIQSAPPGLPAKAAPALVLWIGRIVPQRAPEAFVHLAASLGDLDCDFVMVGPARDEQYLRRVLAMADDIERFRYRGAVSLSESWTWIARAAVLVNTSAMEGLSNALVQAWCCATPTVTLSLDPDGLIEQNGIGMRSGDAPGLARDVRMLVENEALRAEMGATAQALTAREFSGASVGAAYELIFQRAAAHE